jgi:hypothetical protein
MNLQVDHPDYSISYSCVQNNIENSQLDWILKNKEEGNNKIPITLKITWVKYEREDCFCYEISGSWNIKGCTINQYFTENFGNNKELIYNPGHI